MSREKRADEIRGFTIPTRSERIGEEIHRTAPGGPDLESIRRERAFAHKASPQKKKPWHVYFVEALGLNLIKIGRAHNPKQRYVLITVDCPVKTRFLGKLKGGDGLSEAAIHRRFKPWRRTGRMV